MQTVILFSVAFLLALNAFAESNFGTDWMSVWLMNSGLFVTLALALK